MDRPLTQEQMSKLRARSSRAQITPSSFFNEHKACDFKGREQPNRKLSRGRFLDCPANRIRKDEVS